MNAFTSILADTHNWNHMGDWDAGWMWVWGTLMMLGFVALIVWLARSATQASQPPSAPDTNTSARGILAERFAKGELETDEYRERLAELDRAQSA